MSVLGGSIVLVIVGSLLAPSLASHRRRTPPPPPPPTPSPPPPLPNKTLCELSAKCQQGLMTHRPCQQTIYSGQDACYKGLKVWQKDLTARFGCPNFFDKNSTMGSKAFCWCGLGDTARQQSVSSFNSDFLLGTHSMEESANQLSATVTGGKCHNKKDGPALKKRGKTRMANEMKDCGNKAGNVQPPLQGAAELAYLTHCIVAETHPPGSKYAISPACASCFAGSVMCSEQYCIEECACVSWQDKNCNSCMNAHCKSSFHSCSGLKSADAVHVDLDSIDAEDIIGNTTYFVV